MGFFVASCFGIFVAAFIYEGLRFLREQYNFAQLKAESNRCGSNSEPSTKTFRDGALTKAHIVQTILHFIQLTFSYLLMLIAMTFNVWLFFAILLGSFCGYFAFGWVRQKTIDQNNCC